MMSGPEVIAAVPWWSVACHCLRTNGKVRFCGLLMLLISVWMIFALTIHLATNKSVGFDVAVMWMLFAACEIPILVFVLYLWYVNLKYNVPMLWGERPVIVDPEQQHGMDNMYWVGCFGLTLSLISLPWWNWLMAIIIESKNYNIHPSLTDSWFMPGAIALTIFLSICFLWMIPGLVTFLIVRTIFSTYQCIRADCIKSRLSLITTTTTTAASISMSNPIIGPSAPVVDPIVITPPSPPISAVDAVIIVNPTDAEGVPLAPPEPFVPAPA